MTIKQLFKQYRKRLNARRKSKIKADLQNNNVIIPEGGIFCLEINGRNNTVILPPKINPNSYLKIKIFGNNNEIRIDSQNCINAKISIGDPLSPSRDCRVCIGNNTQIYGLEIVLYEYGSVVSIGEDCLFSYGIVLWCTDTHRVISPAGEVLNRGRSVTIGNHVWVGRDVHIAKNSNIPSNSIIGWCSNVTSRFSEENTVIAGNPAQVVKRNVNWDERRVDDAPEPQ